MFKDSTFTANKKWADEFCDALLDAGLKIKWRCNTRVNLVPPPLLEKMKKAGCYVINFGVESGDPEILKTIEKETKIEDVYDAHRRCRKLGIRTYATFLVGNPGETEETVKRTIKRRDEDSAQPGDVLRGDGVSRARRCTTRRSRRAWSSRAGGPRRRGIRARTRRSRRDGDGPPRAGCKIPGFDSEDWQRTATRAFYLRPFFIWDTLVFTLKNPYFARHLLNLGKELVPLYKIRGRGSAPRATKSAMWSARRLSHGARHNRTGITSRAQLRPTCNQQSPQVEPLDESDVGLSVAVPRA